MYIINLVRWRLNRAVVVVVAGSLLFATVSVAIADSPPSRLAPKKKKLPASSKRFAFIVGVGKYDDRDITEVYGDNDANALAEVLIQHAGFNPENVIRLTNDQSLEELKPRKPNIRRELRKLIDKVEPEEDSLFFLAFSGHGVSRAGRQYLLPMDGVDSTDDLELTESAIDIDAIKERIKGRVKQVICVIDACRNKRKIAAGNDDNVQTEEFKEAFNFDKANLGIEAFVTLFATSVGESAYPYQDKKMGYFTYALVEGLEGDAADEDGQVRLGGLLSYLNKQVPKLAGPDKKQKPDQIIEGYADELVLAMKDPEFDTKEVRSFNFYRPPPPEPPAAATVNHNWRRINDTMWEERFRSGTSYRYTIKQRSYVDNCQGTWVSKLGEPAVEYFIPDRGCRLACDNNDNCEELWIMFRQDGHWKPAAAMFNVK